MGEVNPDVLAQMKRIWSALNDGTVDVASANDALKRMHDFLSGAAYEAADANPQTLEQAAEVEGEEDEAPRPDEDERDMPHRKHRRKR